MIALVLLLALQISTFRAGNASQVYSLPTSAQLWQWEDICACFVWSGPPYDQILSSALPAGCYITRWQQLDREADRVVELWFLSCQQPMIWGLRAGYDPPVEGQEMFYEGYCHVPTSYSGTACITPIAAPAGIATSPIWTLNIAIQKRIP